MLGIVEKIVVGLWAVIGAVMVVNAVVLRRWQFGVAAAGLFVVAVGWELLRRHWRPNGAVPTVDATTVVGCLLLVGILVAVAVVMSTLRG